MCGWECADRDPSDPTGLVIVLFILAVVAVSWGWGLWRDRRR